MNSCSWKKKRKMKQAFRIGTRGSKLALWQADYIKNHLLDKFPELKIEIEIIKTTGDTLLNSPLSEIGGKGVFVKEIEEALMSGEIDIAVHSMKDVPTVLPEGLQIGAVVSRHDPRDAFISKNGDLLKELPADARVGTGSLRRASQLLHHLPEIKIIPIRGNVDTRLRKLKDADECDAIVLAVAGLQRMGLADEITEIIPTDIMLPSPGQGIIAIESRSIDKNTSEIIMEINHVETEILAISERAFLFRLGGDCNVPVGCNAVLDENILEVTGVISSLDGKKIIRKNLRGPSSDARKLGEKLADMVLEDGGCEILEELGYS